MSLERQIEEARRKRSPEEQARLDAIYQERIKAVEKRISKQFKDSIVTGEQLNRVISL